MNIDAVKDIQIKKALTNQQFADILGINYFSWLRIKSGRAPLNDKFLVRVHRAFPELGIFLSKDTNKEGKETSQNPDEKHHNGVLARFSRWVRDSFGD